MAIIGELAQRRRRIALGIDGHEQHAQLLTLGLVELALDRAQRVDDQRTGRRTGCVEHGDEHGLAAIQVEVDGLAVLAQQLLVQLIQRRIAVRGQRRRSRHCAGRKQTEHQRAAHHRPHRGVTRTAKAHRARAVGGLHARQHRDAHHHGVVVLLFETQRAGAAEPVAVRIALLAAVVTDHHGTGILDPFPHHSVQVTDAEIVRRRRADHGQRAARRLRIPVENLLPPRRILAGVGPRGAGSGREFPFVPSRQPRPARFAICTRGEPAHLRDRLLRDRSTRTRGACPVTKITFVGEQPRDAVASPFRMFAQELRKVGIADDASRRGGMAQPPSP